MKLSELLGGLPYGVHDAEVSSITNDSRRVEKGTLFFCIRGVNTDGHKYSGSAAAKGAVAVVADHNVGVDCQIIVPDTRVAYAMACSAFYGNPKDKLKLIGITGTNGKTTTAYLIKSMLESLGKKTGMIGTICNIIGAQVLPAANTTPDAAELHYLLRRMVDAGCEYVVMEVSSHALDQHRVEGLHYSSAAFTNITQDHLDYHGTMDNYISAKRRLFGMTDFAVVNRDDAHYCDMTRDVGCKLLTYSVNADSDLRAEDIAYLPSGTNFTLTGDGICERITTRTPGKFSVYNALCAASCMISLGFEPEAVCTALSQASAVKGRAEVVPTDRDFTVIIDYAHTPDGIENILSAMNEIKTGRLVTLFGCGGDRDRTKRPIMGRIAADMSDYCIVTSDNPRTEQPSAIIEDIVAGMKTASTPYTVIENRREAIFYAVRNAKPNDIIVLAGKGHETYQIIGTEKNHFDEREVVAEALAEL